MLTTPSEYKATLQVSLSSHVNHLHSLLDGADQLEKELAMLLAQTFGAFLNSIKGVGIRLAAGVTSEIGDPFSQKPNNNLVSYAGIVTIIKQSGGSEGQARVGHVSRLSNHNLKDC